MTMMFGLFRGGSTGLQPAVLKYMLGMTVGKRFGGTIEADEIGLPVTSTGLVLPCGAAGRWSI